MLTGFGGMDKLEYREDVPEPEPGVGEVRVRVGATAVNNTDIWTREGAYGSSSDPEERSGWQRRPMQFPRIQGADVAGSIDRVGPGVSAERIGQRVLVDPMLYTGDERELVVTDYLGSERDGGFAEWVTVPDSNAHAVDTLLSDAELATFPTAYSTAMRMLGRGALKAGETVVITGASGGVGSALVQLAKAMGATVVAIVGAEKENRIRELGADFIVPRGTKDIYEAASEQVGESVDMVADVVGGYVFPDLLRLLCPLGRYVVAGAIAGPLVETDLRTVYLNQLQLIGSSFGTHEDFNAVLDFVTVGQIVPLLEGTYPLHELKRAQQDFIEKRFVGKLVVTPWITAQLSTRP